MVRVCVCHPNEYALAARQTKRPRIFWLLRPFPDIPNGFPLKEDLSFDFLSSQLNEKEREEGSQCLQPSLCWPKDTWTFSHSEPLSRRLTVGSELGKQSGLLISIRAQLDKLDKGDDQFIWGGRKSRNWWCNNALLAEKVLKLNNLADRFAPAFILKSFKDSKRGCFGY